VGRAPCKICKSVFKEREEEPPCQACFPGVHRFNVAAFALYNVCADQYVTLPGGVSGLRIEAVNIVFDWFDVAKGERPELFEKLQMITHSVIAEINEDAKRKK